MHRTSRRQQFRPKPQKNVTPRKRGNTESRYSDGDGTGVRYGPKDKDNMRERRGTDEEINEAFHVLHVDYNINKNTEDHKTNAFACTEGTNAKLVVRRGQSFAINVTFDREYEKEKHDLRFDFSAGNNPKPSKRLAVEIDMEENRKETQEDPKEWFVKMIGNDQKNCQIKVEITPPANCPIGQWDFSIVTYFRNKPSDRSLKFTYEDDTELIILLNPWCRHDTVYYPKKEELLEYILLEHGCLYVGNEKDIEARSWDHGQFQENILEISLKLIMDYFKGTIVREMGNPITLCRAISSVVNSTYGGLLAGNWSGDYSGGKPPTKWKSSTAILRKYHETGSPVKYGQCWVFSAITTTICRAIGIPCRSVTNFCSAHDTDGSCKIDKEYTLNANGKKIKLKNSDSVWNFHVWNEAWMCRPDIGKRADGWQAFDATPQEISSGDYRCGPASVNLIKQGEIRCQFDSPFIFAEVNSDVYHWVKLSNDQWKLWKIEKNKVGKCISTKEPDGEPFSDSFFFGLFGGTDRLDVTNNYKYKEGSPEERIAVKNAGKETDDIHEGDVIEDDVTLDINIKRPEKKFVGDTFEVEVCAKNVAIPERDLTLEDVSLEVRSCLNNGVPGEVVYSTELSNSLRIPKRKEKEFSFEISYDNYKKGLLPPYAMAITVDAIIKETKDSITEEFTSFRLKRPGVKIDAPSKARKNEPFVVELKVQTNLKQKLTNCTYDISVTEGEDIEDVKIDDKYLTNDGEWEQKVTLQSKRRGECTISVEFDCDQIKDVVGSANIKIV